jgi:hypothetical protein
LIGVSRSARNDEAQGRVEAELAQERAAALGRIGHRLDELIGQLQQLRAAYAAAALARRERRPQLADAYRHLRHEALRYRWYLEVQREAMGLRGGHRLDEFYRVPGPIEP